VSPLDGLRAKLGSGVKINMGAGFMTDIGAAAKASDVTIVFVGNDPTCNPRVHYCQFRLRQFFL